MSFQLCGLICIFLFGITWNKFFKKEGSVSGDNRILFLSIGVIMAVCITAFFLSYYIPIERNSTDRTIYRAVLVIAFILLFYLFVLRHISQKSIRVLKHDSIWLILTCVISGVYCCVLSFKSFPVSEGWYSVYAQYVNSGKMPYKDFELLFMPLYTYLISGITRIFGYDLIVLRIFGVLIFVGLSALSYKMFRCLFNEGISLVASVVAVIYLQSEPPQIFYDYIRVFDILTYSSTLLLMKYIIGIHREKKNRHDVIFLALSGILSACAFLTRQNSGAFVIAYSVILLVFFKILAPNRVKWMHMAAYCISVAIPIAFIIGYMLFSGTLKLFLELTVTSALDAKGGLLTVLFAWIPRMVENVLLYRIFAICLFMLLAYGYYTIYRSKKNSARIERKDKSVGITFALAILTGIPFLYYNKGTTVAFNQIKVNTISDCFYTGSIIVFIIEFIWVILHSSEKDKEWHIATLTLSGMIIAIGYGCGTSAGLSEGQTGLALGLVLGMLLYLASTRVDNIISVVSIAMSVAIVFSAVSYKFIQPYSWWGLTEGDLREATETVDVDYMKGIKVTSRTKQGIESIVNIIKENSEEDDSVFVFPQVPIFYLLSNRYPETYTLVQWFDVANDLDVEKDAELLKEKLPKVIVHVHVHEGIMESHEKLFREGGVSSGLRIMDEALTEIEIEEGYVLAASFNLQNYPVEVWYLDENKETARNDEEHGSSRTLSFDANDLSCINEFATVNNQNIIFPGGIEGGPYIELGPGDYQAIVKGNNFGKANIDVFSIDKGTIADESSVVLNEECIEAVIPFTLYETYLDLEVRVLNNSDEVISVEGITIESVN